MNNLEISYTQLERQKLNIPSITYRKSNFCALFFSLALSVFASPALAQGPAASVGSEVLSVTYEDCLGRAKQALESEGFTAERGGGNFYWGRKGIHHATIICDGTPHPDKKIDFHVFVASTANDGNIPGAERVRLQERMEGVRPGGGQYPTLGGDWESEISGWKPTTIRQEGNKLWFTNEFKQTSAGFFETSTRIKASDWEGGLGATLQDANTIKWDNRTTWRRRGGDGPKPGSCVLTGKWQESSGRTFGEIAFTQNGDQVTGTFGGDRGKMDGTVKGGTLTLRWSTYSYGVSGTVYDYGVIVVQLDNNCNMVGGYCDSGQGCTPGKPFSATHVGQLGDRPIRDVDAPTGTGAFRWVSAGAGDCNGSDIGQTVVTSEPDLGRCNASTVGTIAVCWDGRNHANPARSGQWCTYKSKSARACTGGSNPGYVYECRARQE